MDVGTLGEDVPLLEGIRTTRSIRRLKPDPVPPELVRKVCEAGTFAPSGGNRQPWIFVAVTDPERRAWLAERYGRAWAGYQANAQRAMDEDPRFLEEKKRNLRSAQHRADPDRLAGWPLRPSAPAAGRGVTPLRAVRGADPVSAKPPALLAVRSCQAPRW